MSKKKDFYYNLLFEIEEKEEQEKKRKKKIVHEKLTFKIPLKLYKDFLRFCIFYGYDPDEFILESIEMRMNDISQEIKKLERVKKEMKTNNYYFRVWQKNRFLSSKLLTILSIIIWEEDIERILEKMKKILYKDIFIQLSEKISKFDKYTFEIEKEKIEYILTEMKRLMVIKKLIDDKRKNKFVKNIATPEFAEFWLLEKAETAGICLLDYLKMCLKLLKVSQKEYLLKEEAKKWS